MYRNFKRTISSELLDIPHSPRVIDQDILSRRHIASVQQAPTDARTAWTFFEFGKADVDQVDLDEDIRAAAGVGRRRPGVGDCFLHVLHSILNNSRYAQRRRGEPILSPYVKDLLKRANEANLNRDYDQAIPILREVVQIEPGVSHAWATLATLHRELGHDQEALQLDIVGAHLMEPEPEVWRRLGRESRCVMLPAKTLHTDSCLLRAMNHIQQAIYCFRKILTIDPTDLDALWDRSYLLKIAGDHRRVRGPLLKPPSCY